MYKSDNPSLSDTWDPMPEGIVEDAEDGLSNAMPASRLGDENRQEQIAEGGAVAGPAIRVYLREMGQHALLAKAEEVELSRQIEQGRKTMLKGIGLTWRGSQSLADEIESVLSGERAMDKIVFSGPNGQAAREDDVLERLRPVHRQLTQLAGWSNGRSETARHKKGEEVSEVLSDLRFDPSRLEEIGRDILDLKGQPKERLLRKAKRAIRQGWREMEEARRKMVQGNLRLVISVARHYRNHGLDMLDLIQEGNLGLLKAVDRFDHRRGCKFSTYAVWWIRQTIRRAITTHMRPVRLPANVAELLTKLRTARENLRQDLQRQPDDEELAESLDISIDRVEKLKQVMQSHVSIHTPLGDDGETSLGHIIPDERGTPAPEQVDAWMLRERLDDVLKTLPKREETILRLRYGIGSDRIWTLEEVADRFGVSRERIRQIEVRALRRMRHPRRSVRIKSFLN